MDWGEDMYSNAWVFPRGMPRDGAAGPKSVNHASAQPPQADVSDRVHRCQLRANTGLRKIDGQVMRDEKDPRPPVTLPTNARDRHQLGSGLVMRKTTSSFDRRTIDAG
jgi:hypothetical protein